MTTNPYASSGVDVDAGDRAVELMKADVRATQGLGVLDTAATGGFAGLFDLQFATQGMRRPLLATSTDGVGTKVDLARRLGIWDTVGIDLVGMVVDDLTCAGIRPLFMTDYIACGRVEPERIAALVRGVARACEEVDCALIAGETAEHPGLLGDDEFDIAGAATGVVDERRLLGPARVCAGDVLVGFASSGLHSNGYSLVRRIVAEAGLDWGAPVPAGVCPPVGSPFSGGGGLPGGAGGGGLPGGAGGGALGAGSLGANSLGASRDGGVGAAAGRTNAAPAAPDRDAVGAASRPYTLGLACLEPTRLYSRLCLELENQGGEAAWYAGDFSQDLDGNRTHAFAHVTGGGLAANLARVIPAGLHAVVDRGSWPVPGIFKFLMSAGGLQPVEVEDAWNLGIGMVVAVHPDFVPTTHEAAAAHGIESFTIGRVTDQPPASAQVTGARTVSGTKGIVAGAVTLHGSYCV
ncbi:phosphoribosylformylglycinamidine cyclo-ligase [Mobiluncus mulieris ATCC 35239]|uniref:Phosphoribosylformylglycinamidine cyclo-ligase n=2 Tax=Mobiluncus mulieris TaxID=2052 RepID=E0QP15_9ACTO|nr:phosphoribosylformylglycinamidine cyclo-ligase [Mobiluncus mulieris]EFM46748.1 phosphoribosylformylglycinamidine cyclo-ligase [Mobiluncus mulieris ATCC 35239]MCU9994532.1 phosphoribosylformylglycinamidine cyclo-ligase [Mobiluncus mulieris]